NKAPACESRGFVRKKQKVCILTHLLLVYILSPLFFLGSSSDCRKLRLNFSHCLEVLSRFRYCSQVIILNS
ncbi:hypothetical protein PL586_15210, partial [Phocaeicola vulgatus]|nr:hypothetical protein [Phocaeicola vulgatus]